MKFLFVLSTVLLFYACSNGHVDERIIVSKAFFNSIRDFRPRDSSRLKKTYLSPEINNSSDSVIFKFIIPAAQKEISKKNFDKFNFIAYEKANRDFKNISLEDGLSTKDIYVVEYDNTPYMYLLFSGNKIVSFITLNKGGMRIFMKM